MKNIYDVLRQKENEIQQLQKDIEALRVAARLLAEDNESETSTSSRSSSSNVTVPRMAAPSGVSSVKPAEASSPSVGIRQFP